MQTIHFRSDPRNLKIHKYECIEQIGKGKFGVVFKGKHEKTGTYVAIKTECQRELSILKYETTMLNYLYSKKVRCIPNIYWYGLFENVQYLVMSFYDCSLYDFIHKSDNTLEVMKNSGRETEGVRGNSGERRNASAFGSSKEFEQTMHSLLRVLYSVHEAGIVHRDIKPQNFMMKNNAFFLIDFGMATFYVDENMNHIPEPTEIKQHIMGTLKYISYNVHSGVSYTRRDDIISLAYMYMWLYGLLFWTTNDIGKCACEMPETHILHPKNQYIREQKEIDNIKDYLQKTDVDISPRLLSFIEYAYQLRFNETPDYSFI
jgi:serine/threonine protein kinase